MINILYHMYHNRSARPRSHGTRSHDRSAPDHEVLKVKNPATFGTCPRCGWKPDPGLALPVLRSVVLAHKAEHGVEDRKAAK